MRTSYQAIVIFLGEEMQKKKCKQNKKGGNYQHFDEVDI